MPPLLISLAIGSTGCQAEESCGGVVWCRAWVISLWEDLRPDKAMRSCLRQIIWQDRNWGDIAFVKREQWLQRQGWTAEEKNAAEPKRWELPTRTWRCPVRGASQILQAVCTLTIKAGELQRETHRTRICLALLRLNMPALHTSDKTPFDVLRWPFSV